MAKREAARGQRRPDEVEAHELVDRRERLGLGELRHRRHELRLEGLAGDRGGARDLRAPWRERGQLGVEGCAHRRRNIARGRLGVRGVERAAGVACQLAEVERVSSALPGQVRPEGRRHALPEQALGLGRRERGELEPLVGLPGDGTHDRSRGAEGELARSVGERKQHTRAWPLPQQGGQQLERGVVGPVQIVECQHQGALGRERFEQDRIARYDR